MLLSFYIDLFLLNNVYSGIGAKLGYTLCFLSESLIGVIDLSVSNTFLDVNSILLSMYFDTPLIILFLSSVVGVIPSIVRPASSSSSSYISS